MFGPRDMALTDSTIISIPDDVELETTRSITVWLDRQAESSQAHYADAIVENLLGPGRRKQHDLHKLCDFIRYYAKSSGDGPLRQWVFAKPLGLRLYTFFIEEYEHVPNRSMKLILDVVAMLMSRNLDPGYSIKEAVLHISVTVIVTKSKRPWAKPTIQSLSVLLNKGVVSLGDIYRTYQIVEPSVASLDRLEQWRSLASQFFSWMELSCLCPIAGRVIVQILCGLYHLPASSICDPELARLTSDTMQLWLEGAAANCPKTLEDIKLYVISPLFKTDKSISLELLRLVNSRGPLDPSTSSKTEELDTALLLQIAVLEVGKKNGLVEEPINETEASDGSVIRDTVVALDEGVLDRLLTHPSHEIRASALSLLISSQLTTRPLSTVTLKLLKRHLPGIYCEHEPKFRNETLAHTRDLVKRVKNVMAVAKRVLSRLQQTAGSGSQKGTKAVCGPEAALGSREDAEKALLVHKEFWAWYCDFLKGELIPTASYQRHITAARATLYVLQAGRNGSISDDDVDEKVANVLLSDPAWTRMIFDLVLDPFDDVRETATTLLGALPQQALRVERNTFGSPMTLVDVLKCFSKTAQELARKTGRADYGDGAARLQGLLCKWASTKESRREVVSSVISRLEHKIGLAETDLGKAAVDNPVHGDFSSLSYIWQGLPKEGQSEEELDTFHELQRRILGCCQRMWAAVRHVLCDDSPEGHLPEELEDTAGLDTRDLLSYSFRAIHESSQLLRHVLANLRLKVASGVPFPPFEVFRDGGNLTFDQLSSLRHRGAFSTVAYTFTTCCQLTQFLGDVYPHVPHSDELLRDWYKGTLSCIMNQASTTRRSAGIPALMTGILAANSSSPSFPEIYHKLEEMAKKPARVSETDGSNLPQVHALNCLKAIFHSSLLSKKAEGYLAAALQLAGNSLKSEIWAIRNCGLLLLRSLMDTLFGTEDTKASMETGWDGRTMRISYSKHPSLSGVLLDLLRSGERPIMDACSGTTATEAVFPALDIIRRAGPPEENREELYGYIRGYLGSHLWHVREMAARTLCSFLLLGDWACEVEGLLRQAGNDTNQLHGSLLALKFVLVRKADLNDQSFASTAERLLPSVECLIRPFRKCPEIRAAYFEVVHLVSRLTVSSQASDRVREIARRPRDITRSRSVLLLLHSGVVQVHQMMVRQDLDELSEYVRSILDADVNTARDILAEMPAIWTHARGTITHPQLYSIYMDVCSRTTEPEPRAQALFNLAHLLDRGLRTQGPGCLPTSEDLIAMWMNLQLRGTNINPTLSFAILTVSGPLMAVLVRHADGKLDDLAGQVANWAAMICDALHANNSFDTRSAAARALGSFTAGMGPSAAHPAALPVLLAVYDALLDDDDEVRDLAAGASLHILGTPLEPSAAAESLLDWLGTHHGKAIGREVVCRMAGHSDGPDQAWQSAEEQLRRAMQTDESLFAVEEQNLFVEEVRETVRWRRLFLAAPADVETGEDADAKHMLRAWTEAGLRCLVQLVRAEKDGPLGWTSDQHVFAICARVLLCATALTQSGAEPVIGALLDDFVVEGTRSACHGFLVDMARRRGHV